MLSHKGTTIIETKRLILRPFAETDAKAVFDNWASDPDVVRYLTWHVHPSLEFTKEILSIWEAQYENSKVYNWTIHLKHANQAVGGITVVSMSEAASSCEIGYCLSKAYWGEGVMSEALKAIVKYLFEVVGFERITAKYDERNVASGKVMMKSGMRFVSKSREACSKDGTLLCEMAVYELDRVSYCKATEIKIDRPRLEDLEETSRFFKKVLTYTFESNGINDMAEDLELEIKTKIKYLNQDHKSGGQKRHFLIAKMDDKIVGTIEFGPANALIKEAGDAYLSTLPEIGSVFVDPEYHNLGIATIMLKAICDVLKKQGIQVFCLDSGYGNAQKVWAHKFGVPKIILKDYWGEGLDHMIWQVVIGCL